MSRYIDADWLKESFRKQTVNVPEKIKEDADAIIEAICKDIDLAPTVDAVQVVRCKDCVHGIYGTDETGEYRWCENACNYVDDDAYCADGERKEK